MDINRLFKKEFGKELLKNEYVDKSVCDYYRKNFNI